MKFVFFGYDFSLCVFDRLISEEHQPLAVFSFPCDNQFNFNQELITRVNDLGIPASLEPPTQAHIDALIKGGAELFISAGYLYKIPTIDHLKAKGINIHPAYLPYGRGVMPTPYILTDHPEAAGITLHKITDQIDRGDILLQEKIELRPLETVETYSTRVALKMPDMLMTVLDDIEGYWKNAQPQDEGKATHFPKPSIQMRLLDWSRSVEGIAKTARAFGRYGCIAAVEGMHYAVFDLDTWSENHDFPPGKIVRKTRSEIVISAADGFVILKAYEQVNTDVT